jgi:hypothetical protein
MELMRLASKHPTPSVSHTLKLNIRQQFKKNKREKNAEEVILCW